MLLKMFKTFFPYTKKENKTMANSTQFVVYTRNFKTRAKQIGVFAEPASNYKVNGEVNGGKIKFKNLAVKNTARKTATNKLLSKGLDFTVNIVVGQGGNGVVLVVNQIVNFGGQRLVAVFRLLGLVFGDDGFGLDFFLADAQGTTGRGDDHGFVT